MKGNWRERKELAQKAWRRLRGGELTPRRAALSVGVGMLIGMTPAFGLHWLLVVAVCVPLRLDTGVAYLAANISMPLIAPFITFAEVEMGALLLHGHWLALAPREMKTLALGTVALELVLGTLVVAPAGGALGGAITYLVAWRWRQRGEPQASQARATSRSESETP